MRIKPLLIPFLLCCFACNSESEQKSGIENRGVETEFAFDKTKWSAKEGKDYLYRKQMLNDVLYNDTLRVLNKDEIIEMLGEPDRSNDGYLYYMIAQKRLGFWPLHTKTMVIKLADDSLIDWIKIHE